MINKEFSENLGIFEMVLFGLNPVVDRLVVLFHEAGSHQVFERQKAELNCLKQFYLILEQPPEQLIQFYAIEIIINNTYVDLYAHAMISPIILFLVLVCSCLFASITTWITSFMHQEDSYDVAYSKPAFKTTCTVNSYKSKYFLFF